MRNLLGFLLGVIVGAIGALLFVPLVGKEFVIETQTRVQEAYRHFELNLWGIAHDVKDEVNQALQEDNPFSQASDALGDMDDNYMDDKYKDDKDKDDHDADSDDIIGGTDA